MILTDPQDTEALWTGAIANKNAGRIPANVISELLPGGSIDNGEVVPIARIPTEQ
jgi:hypothetical protein